MHSMNRKLHALLADELQEIVSGPCYFAWPQRPCKLVRAGSGLVCNEIERVS